VVNDADADIVKIFVDEVRLIARLVAQRMAFVATGTSVEQLPSTLGAFIDGVLVAGDKVIKRRIERELSAFV
jgi:Kef-type K+ transport system membrane component KefB